MISDVSPATVPLLQLEHFSTPCPQNLEPETAQTQEGIEKQSVDSGSGIKITFWEKVPVVLFPEFPRFSERPLDNLLSLGCAVR